MRNRDLLAQILAGGEDARVSMKELCALVQSLCSAGRCTEDQWKGVQDAMKIPHPKPDNVPWRYWIREWCSLLGSVGLSWLAHPWSENGDPQAADLLKMQWIFDYCNPMADADEYKDEFIRMMRAALFADHYWISYINYHQLSFPLIRLLESYSPPDPDMMNLWALFFQSLAIVAEKNFNREQCTEICNFIMESPTFASFFVDPNSWPNVNSRLTALSKLLTCSARYYQPTVFEFVLRIHRSAIPQDTQEPTGAVDSRSIWVNAILTAAKHGNLDAFEWMWRNLDDASFGLQTYFALTLVSAMESGNADLVEFILRQVWNGQEAVFTRALHKARRPEAEYPEAIRERLEEMAPSYGQ